MIERIRRERLRTEIKSYGLSPTLRQSLMINTRRKTLADSLHVHREQATVFCSSNLTQRAFDPPQSIEGHPELLSTLLPSHFPPGSLPEHTHAPMIETEKELRRVSCLKSLQDIRSLVAQKAHYTQVKTFKTKGTVVKTRAQSAVDGLTTRMMQARWEYQHSRQQLFHLGASAEDRSTLRELNDSDLRELSVLMRGDHTPGQGFRSLPWYWRVKSETLSNPSDDVSELGARVASEYEESQCHIHF
jgi:hypothetical protein